MADYRTEATAAHPYNAVGGRDYLAWAKQIMYREKKGDSNLTFYQVKEAKIALGLIDKTGKSTT